MMYTRVFFSISVLIIVFYLEGVFPYFKERKNRLKHEFPNLIIADLRDSDLRQSRDMYYLGQMRFKWELDLYDIPAFELPRIVTNPPRSKKSKMQQKREARRKSTIHK